MQKFVWITLVVLFAPAMGFAQADTTHRSLEWADMSFEDTNPWLYELTAVEINIFAQEKDRYAVYIAEMGDTWQSVATTLNLTEAFVKFYQCPDLKKPMPDLKPGDFIIIPTLMSNLYLKKTGNKPIQIEFSN